MKTQNVPFVKRRDFLKKTAGAAVLVAPGITFMNLSNAYNYNTEPVTNDMHWGMLIDANKCIDGCTDCIDACQNRNGWGIGSTDEANSNSLQKSQWIRKVTVHNKSTNRTISLPIMCQHCENPTCVDVCPTGASFKRADGIVLVDKHRCIGCRYCIMACPYKARSFIHEALSDQKAHSPRGKGTVEACNLCSDLIDKEQIPVCVTSCKNGAIIFGNLNDKTSEISIALQNLNATKIRDDLGLNPSIAYHGI